MQQQAPVATQAVAEPAPAPVDQQQQQTQSQQLPATTQAQPTTASNNLDPGVEASLLAGQPPGTVIKCVTAQVIQTNQGPRIVLQGLQGADFSQSQLNAVQQQVKQQLLKGCYIILFT